MGRFVRKCKGSVGEIAVIHHQDHGDDDHEVGVITRARALAMVAASASGARKRKNIDASREEEVVVRVRSRRRVRITPDASEHDDVVGGGGVSPVNSSRCSSDGSWSEEVVRSVDADLKGEGLEFESSNSYSDCTERRRRERDRSSDHLGCSEFEEDPSMEGTGSPSYRSSTTANKEKKMPSAAEIEEFFSAVEKDNQKRFAHKYNYDVVKDVPLEGRYEWVQLKP